MNDLLLKRFDDLKKAHEAVVYARKQHQILKPLACAGKSLSKLS
jgi:hypothetical protein